jgi:hypothetical protein
LAGTLAYMSPEQAEGKQVDARADLFSLGAVFYEMLIGKSAFGRDSPVATLVAVMSQQPDSIGAIPQPHRSIIVRALRKDRRERWHAAADLRFALEEAAQAPLTTHVKVKSRREILLWAGGAAAVAASAASIVTKRLSVKRVPTFEQLTFNSGEIMTARFGSDASSAYLSFRGAGAEYFQLYETHFGTRTMRQLDLPPSYIQGVSISGELAVVLIKGSVPGILGRASRDGGPVKELAGETHFAGWGPDGKSLMAVRSGEPKARLEYPLGTVIAESETSRGFPFQYAILSRDGRKVAYFRPEASTPCEELCIIQLEQAGFPVRVLSGNWGFTSPLHWTAEDDEVWFSGSRPGGHSGVWACTMRGRERCLLEAPGKLVLQDIRASDQAVLAVSHDTKTSIHVSHDGGDKETQLPGSKVEFISDDGGTVLTTERIAGSDQTLTIFVWNRGNKTPFRVAEGQTSALSRDGNFVAVATSTGSGQRLLIVPVGAGDVRDVTRPGFFCESLLWFRDGKRLVATGREPGQDRRSYVLSLEDHSFQPVTSAGTWAELVSGDGRNLLARDRSGDLLVVDLVSGKTRIVAAGEFRILPMAWHADGRSFFYAEALGNFLEMGIMQMDLANGKTARFRTIGASGALVRFPVITPDGQHLSYVTESTNSTLYLVRGLAENA